MAEPAKIPAPGAIWSHFDLDEFAKVIAILGAIAYATGVIAINTYLHGLGIVDFSFAKPKLLLTGIVVLFTYLLLAGPAFFLARSLATRHEQGTRRLSSLNPILMGWLAGALILLIGASVFYCFKGPSMGQSTIWKVWELMKPGDSYFRKFLSAVLVALVVYLPILFAIAALYAVARLLDEEKAEEATQQISPRERISPRRFLLAIAVAVFVMATIVYIYFFTNTFYSVIPQEFGGGQPYFQSFAIGKDNLCEVQQLGIPFALGQSNVTQPLPVLHETDTLVAVWLNDTSRGSWNFVVAMLDKKVITATKVIAKPDSPFPPLLTSVGCKD